MKAFNHVLAQPKRTLGIVLSCFALAACGHQRDAAPEADAPEADAPEADAPEADAPEADASRALPPGGSDAVDPLATDARLSMLASMMSSAGMTGELRGASGRTLFAPTNNAFGAFFDQVNDGEECARFLTSSGLPTLRKILRYQLVPGRFLSTDIVDALAQQPDGSLEVNTALPEGPAPAQIVVTASTEGGILDLNGGNQSFGGADVIFVDITLGNTVIHLVDRILLSPGVRSTLEALPADAACRPKPGDIVTVASSNPDFSTLVDLVASAGLVGALQSPGPFTVFAPTNAAFADLLGQVEDGAACVDFLKGPGKPVLTQILLYHVAAGRLEAAQIVGALAQEADGTLEVDTLLGEGDSQARLLVRAGEDEAILALNGGAAELGGAGVVAVDVGASNGVIHVVNGVLLSDGLKGALSALPAGNPCRPKPGDLVAVASSNPDLSTLVDLVASAGLVDALQSPGPFTVFAPTNAAFGTFLGGVNDGAACIEFLKGTGKPVLTQILLYHVVGDELAAADVVADPDRRLPTLLSEGHPAHPAELKVSIAGNQVRLNGGSAAPGGATLLQTDVRASNGIAHLIDDVLLSPGLLSTLLHLPADAACRPRTH